MTISDEESTIRQEPSKKKKKQKNFKNRIMTKSQHLEQKPKIKKKKQKTKAWAAEEASEITDGVPKKKTTLDISGDPTSARETHNKKRKKDALHTERTCDAQTDKNVPKKKKKKNAAVQKSIDPVHEKNEKLSAVEDTKESGMKKKKKKKKDSDALDSQSTSECVRTNKGVTEDRSMILEDDVITKQKKKGTKKVLSKDEDIEADQTANKLDCPNSDSSSKVRKRKKSKPAENISEDEASETVNNVTDDLVIQKKKNKKEDSELWKGIESPKEVKPEMSDYAKVKKKKKKVTFENAEEATEDHGGESEKSSRVSKERKTSKDLNMNEGKSDVNDNRAKDRDSEEAPKKKKKGKKSNKMTELVESKEESLHKTCKEEKKKSKKKRKREEMLGHSDEEQSANEDIVEAPKKKQKKKMKNPEEAIEKRETPTGNQLGLAQDGSRDEVHIDTGTKFGQWDTAAFQNSDQQTKFFRLLGGFKKGNQAAGISPSNQVKANMALGKQQEQALERNLMSEFDKALSWKQNRGIGLGFQPTPNKSFFIDKTVSRSVKFDD
ncbi:lysine-rich nucleolar protein 1 isoform X2 [Dendropsophus ebraccatus]|uniref:lysine-rich nucleolar protein 1 isoform X2 n=1 Tax=Dendropsophus ebraccatus TaxID=150705 RepID=UPI003831C4C1